MHDDFTAPQESEGVEVSPWESCERGHVLNRTGYTKRKTCFECGLFRAHKRPTDRYFVLHGLKNLRGERTISEIARKAGVPTASVSEYAYLLKMVPEERVGKIAGILGVTEDELKGLA